METDRLKGLWQQRNAMAKRPADGEVAQVVARFARWRRQVRWRDYRECAAAFICIAIFARLAFVLPSAIARGAAAFLVATCLLTIVMLIRANPGRHETEKATSVREFCESEIRHIESQIRLLRSVAYWCVVPIVAGVNVLFGALSPRLLWTVVYLGVTLVFGWWLIWINRRAAERRLVPLREELVRILGEES